MTKTEKIESLDRLIAELSALEDEETYHREFEGWRQRGQRIISRIFEKDQLQVQHFSSIRPVRASLSSFRAYGSSEGSKKQVFKKVQQFRSFLEPLKDEIPDDTSHRDQEVESKNLEKIFISHASEDEPLVSAVVNLLSLIGVPDKQIFCTSLPGYDIDLGDNWLDTLKKEITDGVLVLFVLSENYFQSTICLCEMGAAWALSKKHIPILLPTIDFEKARAVIPLTQGMKINQKHKWTKLKSQLESMLKIDPRDNEIWERGKDEILARIEELLNP